MTDDTAPASAGARRYVRYSVALARRILARVAPGESLVSICAEPDMPSRNSLTRWARGRPKFGAAMAKARAAAGTLKPGGVSGYCPVIASEIFQRLCAGESMAQITRDPDMPAYSTVVLWRRNVPEFGEAMRVAREVQAERFCDMGWELACEATPDTAYLTHVRLGQLRWMTAVMAPRSFGRLKPQEPQDEAPGGFTVVVKRFTDAPDPDFGGAVLAPGEQRIKRLAAPG